MARKKIDRDYGPDVTVNSELGKIACHFCRDAKEAINLHWLALSSWDAHVKSVGHIKAVQKSQEAKKRAEMAHSNYERLYSSMAVPLKHASLPSLPIEPHIAPYSQAQDINGISAEDFDFSPEEQEVLFPIDDPSRTKNEQARILREEIELMHLTALEEEFEGADDETVPHLASEFRDMGLGPEAADEEDVNQFFNVGPEHDYWPYESKTMCYLDILDNLPRLRLSSSQLKMILWIMRECGAHDVPSFKAFRAMQKRVRDMCGISVTSTKSDLGNLFYSTDIGDLISKDFANPEVSAHIQRYPEDTAGAPISEIWQLPNGRWTEIPLDKLPPSILVNKARYYIHEIAELIDGQWIIPQKWISRGGKTYAESYTVLHNADRRLSVERTMVSIPIQNFRYNHEQLVLNKLNTGRLLQFDDMSQEFASRIPNLHRSIDNGEDLFTIWVSLWADDVSGARSKQYQKHINIYMSNVNLPGRLLQQEYFVRFISTSPNASALEQFKPVIKRIKETHVRPIGCYNAAEQRPCGARILVADLPADNPQQSEETSHIGHQGKCKCRGCLAGGENGFTATPDGYHTFYEIGPLRNVVDIRNCVLRQIELATYGVESHIEALQTKTGVKDKISLHWIEILVAEARKRQAAQPDRSHREISHELLTWLGTQTTQPYNPLLDMDFLDPSQDTLVEILHTILLGLEKYAWYDLHSKWSSQQQDIFTIRLQSTNIDGLRIPPIRAAYMMQYRNNLIGKHFKTLMQTSIFHIQDLVSQDLFALAKALGELGPVLWAASIDEMDEYLEDLQTLIDNVLDAFSVLDPAKILIKIKLHFSHPTLSY